MDPEKLLFLDKTNGDDANDGSQNAPFKTIERVRAFLAETGAPCPGVRCKRSTFEEPPCGNYSCGNCKKANARKKCQNLSCEKWIPVKCVECQSCKTKQLFQSPKQTLDPPRVSEKTSTRSIVNRCLRGLNQLAERQGAYYLVCVYKTDSGLVRKITHWAGFEDRLILEKTNGSQSLHDYMCEVIEEGAKAAKPVVPAALLNPSELIPIYDHRQLPLGPLPIHSLPEVVLPPHYEHELHARALVHAHSHTDHHHHHHDDDSVDVHDADDDGYDAHALHVLHHSASSMLKRRHSDEDLSGAKERHLDIVSHE